MKLSNLSTHRQIKGLISLNRRLCALLIENQPVDFEHVLSQVVRGVPVIVVVVDVDNFHGAATPVVDGEGAEKEGVFWGGMAEWIWVWRNASMELR